MVLILQSTYGEEIKVLTTSKHISAYKDGSGAQLKNPPILSMKSFTICWRFYEFSGPQWRSNIIQSIDPNKLKDNAGFPDLLRFMHTWKNQKGHEFYGFLYKYEKFQWNIPPMQWFHVCFGYDYDSYLIKMVIYKTFYHNLM